jgi:hypothetical protein
MPRTTPENCERSARAKRKIVVERREKGKRWLWIRRRKFVLFHGKAKSEKAGRTQTRAALGRVGLSGPSWIFQPYSGVWPADSLHNNSPQDTPGSVFRLSHPTMTTGIPTTDQSEIFKQLDEYPWDKDKEFQVRI